MIKLLWALFAQNSVIDQQSNNISIHNVIEEVTFDGEALSFPAIVPIPTQIICLWLKEKGKVEIGEMRIKVLDPKGKEIGEVVNPISFPAEHKRMRTIIQLNQIPVSGAGRHVYEIFITTRDQNMTKAGELLLDIILSHPAEK